MSNESRCGYVALIGRPNVGKSTLLNSVLGQKLSIVAAKPQTTRQSILGIKSTDQGQILFLDTPGIHLGGKTAINRYMNKAASSVIRDVDLVLFLVEGERWNDEDSNVLNYLKKYKVPVILGVNKVDLIKPKQRLLPLLDDYRSKMDFLSIIPLSAKTGIGLDSLEDLLFDKLPLSRPFYDNDQLTDRSEKFIAAEFVREQLIRRLHQELPYAITVEIETFKRGKSLLDISAIIWTERDSQKGIIIGKGGQVLKDVGRLSRIEMEKMFSIKINLKLWVKVRSGWSDDEQALKRFGFYD